MEKILSDIFKSKYSLIAEGYRDVGENELFDFLKIIFSKKEILKKLNSLYDNHPDTIAMDKSMVERSCQNYHSGCNCYLPNVDYENYTCVEQRNSKIKFSKKRNYPEYIEWRMLVFSRDSFTCQICCKSGGELNAHHIKSYRDYPELRIDVSNGLTLCESCHKIVHQRIRQYKTVS